MLFLTYFDFQLATKPGSPESLQQLIEIVRNPNPVAASAVLSGFAVGKEDKTRQSRDKKVTRERDAIINQAFPHSDFDTFILLKQAVNQSIANREDYSNAESVEPVPANLHDQV